ncbi:GTP-binding protein [Actinorugispora endophytica]|uniref:G3E family GTPase n=1 Tax=Actinorugispora endophytica TaxID=1605990 RepID=A0A4R6V9R8_9ACTN|nr:GTP-binding protein [Actinorugispora endophytica]TDQ53266.1 G3E family GTPase [Actinorugispora endophytica]
MRVAVVTGMHRSARQQTVDALLATTPRSVAVFHDMEKIRKGAVDRVIRDRSGRSDRREVNLVHACASCTLREDLVPLLLRMAEDRAYDLCVVDAWDGVEPRPVCEAIAAEKTLTLAVAATAVDAGRLLDDLDSDDDLRDRGIGIAQDDERTVSEVLARQVEYPSAVVLHGSSGADHAFALLAQLNPGAAIIPATEDLSALVRGAFDTEAAFIRTNPAWAQYGDRADGHVRTVTWTRTRPLHPQRLADALEGVLALAMRGRGRFWLASQSDNLLVWDSHNDLLTVENGGPWLGALPEAAMDLVPAARRTSALLDWTPETGDRRQHMAFTGIGLDADRLVALLDSCLVTAGESDQEFQEDPFAEFSER